MKRSLVILLTAVSISAMTAGTAFPAFAEATELSLIHIFL